MPLAPFTDRKPSVSMPEDEIADPEEESEESMNPVVDLGALLPEDAPNEGTATVKFKRAGDGSTEVEIMSFDLDAAKPENPYGSQDSGMEASFDALPRR